MATKVKAPYEVGGQRCEGRGQTALPARVSNLARLRSDQCNPFLAVVVLMRGKFVSVS